MKIGLFFGSFNPIHIGHLVIGEYMATQTDLQQVWLVVSPQNPLKPKHTLANDYNRLHLVRLAIQGNPHLNVSDIEFKLPKPSYTIDTLTYLKEKYPQHEFALIMGGDNLATIHKWKNYEQILEYHQLYVYQRPNEIIAEWEHKSGVKIAEAPLMDISSTYIRALLKAGKSTKYLLPDIVLKEIQESGMYL